MPELPGIIDPSVGTFAGELREEPQRSHMEEAIRRIVGYDVPPMDPEIRNAVMGFGPGQLPTAAGIFTSNIANAVRKGLAEHYPSTGGSRHVARLMEMLKEVPQSVMDRIEKFTLTGERPIYPKKTGGTASALGVYHPMGERESFRWGPEGKRAEEVKTKSPRLMPEVEAQGIDLATGRTGSDVVDTIIHEIAGHGVVGDIRRKVGWKGSEQLIDVAGKDPFFGKYLKEGREEPFARMTESMLPGEYQELMQPYFQSLKESPGTRVTGLPERERLDKAIRRARARAVKEKGASKTAEKIPTVEGLKYNGIQKIPDYPDQYVFTDKQTGSTFYTSDKTPANLLKERDRVRAKYEAVE
jgi:hypothetical protein